MKHKPYLTMTGTSYASDHLVLRVWNPSKRRFFQVDSIKDDEGIECYELRGADYIRPGKALFAMYEKVGGH